MAFARILDGDIFSLPVTAGASPSLPIAAQSSSIPVAAPATFSHQFTKKLEKNFVCCNNKLNLLSKP